MSKTIFLSKDEHLSNQRNISFILSFKLIIYKYPRLLLRLPLPKGTQVFETELVQKLCTQSLLIRLVNRKSLARFMKRRFFAKEYVFILSCSFSVKGFLKFYILSSKLEC